MKQNTQNSVAVNILIVDDNPNNLEAMEAVLRNSSYGLVTALSGEEALKILLNQQNFAVVLLDVQLGGIDGYETANLIRSRDLTKSMPIIFITAYERKDIDVLKGYAMGAVDYIFKPAEPAILKAKVGFFVELFIKNEQLKQQAMVQREKELLHKQTEQLMAVFNKFPEMLYVVDPKTHEVLFANNTYIKALGRNPVGSTCYKEFYGFDSPCDFCTNESVLKHKDQTYTWECHNSFLGKELQVTDQMIEWPDNREVKFQLAIDITESKKAQKELRTKSEALARSNAELEQFAYIISHDLQEPLRSISGFLQLIEKRVESTPDTEGFITRAIAGADRMRDMILGLLKYSRIGTHGKQLKPTDSRAALKDALDNLDATIQDVNAKVDVDSTLPMVRADVLQLILVFQNLIGNGIKFRGEREPQIRITAEKKRNLASKPPGDGQFDFFWQFSVKDNGIGIDPKYADRIFLIFQRLHTRTEYAGNGLGLAICKKIVERHKGKIWFESKPGCGTTFFFTLPGEPMEGSEEY